MTHSAGLRRLEMAAVAISGASDGRAPPRNGIPDEVREDRAGFGKR